MPKYKRIKNTQPDVPDKRDWMYRAPLIQLRKTLDPPENLVILDQKSEGSCTGFAVAAAINRLYEKAGQDIQVSPRMLYEMAKRHDEWPGETYDGSSLRGAIHGWKSMGVCKEEMWPYLVKKKGYLTIKRAKDAREHTIGAYYRVKPVISDIHAAINETGVVAVSANVHRGWDNPKYGIIKQYKHIDGGHAFIIVGYNEKGFWIQNSWGPSWGKEGLALWSYEDWIANVMDAWVFRLALPTPQIFGLRAESSALTSEDVGKTEKSAVVRSKIAGHYVHIDDGAYKESGKYWSNGEDVAQTAEHVANSPKYKHLLIYVHGGLNSPKDSARRIAAMKDVFKENKIYPFHIMYDTGIVEELKDLIVRKESTADERVGGILSDWTDRFVEGLVRRPGTLLWEEMKQDANDAFTHSGAGTDALTHFTQHLRKTGKRMKFHLAGHSTGAIVIAHLLKTMKNRQIRISSCSLMAPACSVDLYHDAYLPVLQRKTRIRMDDLTIYNLKKELELDDNVMKIYRKSLLYLVSNALERDKKKPILGMEEFKTLVTTVRTQPKIIYSSGTDGRGTKSTTHGGFDNDPDTMNHILKRILGSMPVEKFTKKILKY